MTKSFSAKSSDEAVFAQQEKLVGKLWVGLRDGHPRLMLNLAQSWVFPKG